MSTPRKYQCLPECDCVSCDASRAIRRHTPGWECRADCNCENCRNVRELADAREAGAQDARVAKAYADGVIRGLRG